jgi:hypothetical protein
MKHKVFLFTLKIILITLILLSLPVFHVLGAKKPTSVKVVGLYSETDAGSISYRIGSGKWIVVKIGQEISVDAEIMINVDRDWLEIIPTNKPNEVYELAGSVGETVIKKVSEILKTKKRKVDFPKEGDKPDKKFENKVVVKEYWGKQNFRSEKTGFKYIRYGDVLEADATVQIIAINNTLRLVFANGEEKKVIGPLKFTVEKLLKGENLYKYLNVK